MKTILTGIVGSTAYGLDTPESDIDRLSVHVTSTTRVLGFGLGRGEQTLTTSKPDSTSHEIGKYLALALAGNPTILEAMWLSEYEVLTPAGQELVGLRNLFLSAPRIRSAYGGYALQQVNRLVARQGKGRGGFPDIPTARTAKHARHCYRLILQARDLLKTGTLTVRLESKDVATVRMAGEWSVADPEDFAQHVRELISILDKIPSSLPDEPDRATVERWLVSVRLREPHDLV